MLNGKKIHFIGIGGVSMSGIAEMVNSMGAIVTGSDISESKITNHLKDLGFQVLYGHHPELVAESDIVVYTAAIPENDPERIQASELKKEAYERAEFLGKLTKLYKNCLCISGTHGKSTTTGMVSMIFLEAKKNPTIQIGAIMKEIHSTSYIGGHEYLIMEACEYVDSFLHFHPTAEIITNIDNDHLDYFHNLENIKNSFHKYTNLLPQNGYLIINKDDENSKDIEENTQAKVITYGLTNDADYIAKNIQKNEMGHYSFDIYKHHGFYLHIDLNISGKQNIYNALAATALCSEYIEKEQIKKGLEKYQGVERRFEYIGEYHHAKIYDDYAHHPTEILSTLNSVKEMKYHESWAIFQPHTYSRTKEHLEEFAEVLSKFDHIIIATIYGAREINHFDINENMLVEQIKRQNQNVCYIDSFDNIVTFLKENVKENDMIITIGAGPVNKIAYSLKDSH